MNSQDNIWCVAIFKHGKAAIIVRDIKTYTLAKSNAVKQALKPEYTGALVKAVETDKLEELFDKDVLTIEELLKIK